MDAIGGMTPRYVEGLGNSWHGASCAAVGSVEDQPAWPWPVTSGPAGSSSRLAWPWAWCSMVLGSFGIVWMALDGIGLLWHCQASCAHRWAGFIISMAGSRSWRSLAGEAIRTLVWVRKSTKTSNPACHGILPLYSDLDDRSVMMTLFSRAVHDTSKTYLLFWTRLWLFALYLVCFESN
jgi:hypothetical protein